MFIYRKNRRKKKNKDGTDNKNRKEKCFRGWRWRFHGWLNVWLTDTETHLDEWLAEFLWQKYVNGNRVDILVGRNVLW